MISKITFAGTFPWLYTKHFYTGLIHYTQITFKASRFFAIFLVSPVASWSTSFQCKPLPTFTFNLLPIIMLYKLTILVLPSGFLPHHQFISITLHVLLLKIDYFLLTGFYKKIVSFLHYQCNCQLCFRVH